jgi:hypothetical protein
MGFEPGGLADKLGNRYEGRWIAKQLLRLLNEEIRSVTIEAIGDDERGVDLWIVQNDGVQQAQQCKARNGNKESWSISDLKSRGILSHLQFQLNLHPQHEFALVSGVGATLFQDICNSARFSNHNPEDFFRHQIQAIGQTRRDGFRQFCESLGLDPGREADRARAFDYLIRTHFILYPDDYNTWQDLLTGAGYLLTGNPETIVSTLITYAESNDIFRKPIYADELQRHLTTLGINPKLLAYDQRIAPAIEALQQQFEETILPGLIGGRLIPREETNLLVEAFEEKKNIILHGAAGYGKSAVLYGLTGYLRKKNIPYLPIRLDRRDPKNTAPQFGRDMGLPDSPVYSLSGLAGERQCVLILDQLDAIRWTSAHSSNALDVCRELVGQAQSLRQSEKNIVVILCCRTFDLEHDPEIRNWLANLPGREFRKVEVKALPTKTLEKIVGPSLSQMTDRQKLILACPQNLAIWMELKDAGTTPEFRSTTELMRRFWENRRLVLERAGIPMEQMETALNALVDYMEGHGKISAPERVTANWPKVTKALFSHGILQVSAGQITFCHQSYLDHLIADRLLRQIDRGTGTVVDWLGSKERQSLFRREQLRQTLVMLSEESSGNFLRVIKELLESERVRFHLKHLALEILGQLEDVNEEIGAFCLGLINNDYWKEHILETVCWGHSPHVSLLIEKGIITAWLNSDIKESANRALLLLGSINEKIPDRITELLEPYVEQGANWPSRVLNAICWNLVDDSERMFQLRLRLVRLGIFSSFVHWSSLCSKHPIRALRLIEAVLSTWKTGMDEDAVNGEPPSKHSSRIEDWYDDDIKALNSVAENYPTATWDLFIPHVERLTTFEADAYNHRLEKWQDDRFSPRHRSNIEIARGVVELIITAGRKLADKKPDELLLRTKSLDNSISPIIQEILISAYAHLPAAYADIGIRWLLGDIRRLALGSGYDEPEWMPAVRLVSALSPHCSAELFHALEEAIVHYHSSDERRLAEHYAKGWRQGHFGDYWGRAQHFVLPALDPRKMRPSTISLVGVLKRKYVNYPEERFLKGGRISGGSIGSKLDASLEKINDRSWLAIVSNKKIPEHDNKWEQLDEDHAVESTIRQFSLSLRNIAKRFPERSGQLSLHFPDNTHPFYVSAILDALMQKNPGSEIPEGERPDWHPACVETVEKVLQRFQAGDERETAISFCRLIGARADDKWSGNTLERLIRYAMSHPDLEPGKLNVHCDKTADEASVDMLFQNTINCVRGVAAESIGRLLWNNADLLKELRPAIESLVNDPHPAVRMASIEALLPVLNIDKDQAVAWFCEACKNDLRVAASPRGVLVFNYTVSSHFDKIASLIRAMVRSPLDEVSQEGAEEVTARWLFHRLFEEELDRCRKGTIVQRKGVVQIAAHFFSEEKYRVRCQELLLPLLDDPEKEVRAETRSIFRSKAFPNQSISIEFLKIYVRSKAFADDPVWMVNDLRDFPDSLVALAEIIFAICEVYSTTLREKSREIGSRVPHTVSDVCSLLLRLYEQSQASNNVEIANRCLDIWDMLFENRVGIIRELTRAIEK